ncbi:MAG TPA: DUF2800 domain-containing protein, partial [Burkholderiaceae bacterium]
KAVRERAHSLMLSGEKVPGLKLVLGREGNRAWADPAVAEVELKKMLRSDDKVYERKLISPTTADKMHAIGDIGPRQWPKVQALITRAKAQPTVVPESDPRPVYAQPAVADDFDAVAEDEVGDLV